MKNRIRLYVMCLALATGTSGLGQSPTISSFSRNGQLTCTNLQPGSAANVQSSSLVVGPWTNLTTATADVSGTIKVGVPLVYKAGVSMFFRVSGVGRGTNTLSLPTGMASIPSGAFSMGDTFNSGHTNELPLRNVQVGAFYMDRYEITLEQWTAVVRWANTNGYSFPNAVLQKDTNHPVVSVRWYDAIKWCNARSEKEGKAPAYYTSAAQTNVYRSGDLDVQNDWVKWNGGYRLPTEAEWEKAARGGVSGHRFPWSDVNTISHARANYYSAAGYVYDVSPTRGTHPGNAGQWPLTSPVGSLAPNGYGLYDMAGNAAELCWDRYGAYSKDDLVDPRGPTTGTNRVTRGGNWGGDASECRTSARLVVAPGQIWNAVGFRCVLSQ